MKHRLPICLWATILVLGIVTPVYGQRVIYVDTDAVGANDGSSWLNAFVFLQDALSAVHPGDEVWVAEGAYRPDQGAGFSRGDRKASFVLRNEVALYGGFNGTESVRTERDWNSHETTLDGDLLQNDDELISLDNPLRADNALHVLRAQTFINDLVLDGFTITGGMANETGDMFGSAMDATGVMLSADAEPIRISNCRFSRNVSEKGTIHVSAGSQFGGVAFSINHSSFSFNRAFTAAGMAFYHTNATVTDVAFTDNSADHIGVLQVLASSVRLSNSRFTGNLTDSGGIVDAEGVAPEIPFVMWNTFFADNDVSFQGAIIEIHNDSSFRGMNLVLTGNRLRAGGAFWVMASRASISNSVIASTRILVEGAAFRSEVSELYIANSILWNNEAPASPDAYSLYPNREPHVFVLRNSLVQDSLPWYVTDAGNLSRADPSFVNPQGADNIPGTPDDDFRLQSWSPAVDSGTNAQLPLDQYDLDADGDMVEFWPLDFDGRVRIFDGGGGSAVVDIGPYEFNAPLIGTYREYSEYRPVPRARLETFPVPAIDEIFVSPNFTSLSSALFEMFDTSGRSVRRIHISDVAPGDTIRLPMHDLAPGAYVLTEHTTRARATIILSR